MLPSYVWSTARPSATTTIWDCFIYSSNNRNQQQQQQNIVGVPTTETENHQRQIDIAVADQQQQNQTTSTATTTTSATGDNIWKVRKGKMCIFTLNVISRHESNENRPWDEIFPFLIVSRLKFRSVKLLMGCGRRPWENMPFEVRTLVKYCHISSLSLRPLFFIGANVVYSIARGVSELRASSSTPHCN